MFYSKCYPIVIEDELDIPQMKNDLRYAMFLSWVFLVGGLIGLLSTLFVWKDSGLLGQIIFCSGSLLYYGLRLFVQRKFNAFPRRPKVSRREQIVAFCVLIVAILALILASNNLKPYILGMLFTLIIGGLIRADYLRLSEYIVKRG